MGISITNCLSRSFCLSDSDQLPPARERRYSRRLKKRPPRAGIFANTAFQNHRSHTTVCIRREANGLDRIERDTQLVDDGRYGASEVWDTRLGSPHGLIHEQEDGRRTSLSESASNLEGW